MLTADLEKTRFAVMIAELSGCLHADGFGQIERLTPAEERRLIAGALDAFELIREPPATTTFARARTTS